MSKKSPPPPPPATPWVNYLAVGLLGLLFGASLMWIALRASRPSARPAGAPAAAADPASHRPSPELTAGQSPAQADRTLGNFYYDHQNWPQAIQRYEAAIRQGSDDADIRTDLGNAYRFAGRPDDALAQYNLAQQMNPAHEFSLFNQGGLYLEDLKQTAKAVETWEQYLRRFPNGRNVAAARQLIAQAQGSAPAGTPQPEPDAATEELILRRIQAGQAPAAKP